MPAQSTPARGGEASHTPASHSSEALPCAQKLMPRYHTRLVPIAAVPNDLRTCSPSQCRPLRGNQASWLCCSRPSPTSCSNFATTCQAVRQSFCNVQYLTKITNPQSSTIMAKVGKFCCTAPTIGWIHWLPDLAEEGLRLILLAVQNSHLQATSSSQSSASVTVVTPCT